MEALFGNVLNIQWQQVVMWAIGGLLIWLAIKKDMEPTLLLPMGFGAILVNLPLSGAVTQVYEGVEEVGVIDLLFNNGIANELFPLLLFIGIGAMIDFDPLLTNPKLMIIGLGLFAFVFDTAGGVLFAKFLNLFLKKKVNPMIGAAGISAFPMSARVVHKMGLAEDPQNFLLMHSTGVNVSGQIASVIAGGLILNLIG